MSDAIDLPGTTLDVAAYPDFPDLVDEVIRRLGYHGSLVIVDANGRAFPGFLVELWRGAYVVRGAGQRHLGTFASVEAAIRTGIAVRRDDEAGDERADALA